MGLPCPRLQPPAAADAAATVAGAAAGAPLGGVLGLAGPGACPP
ncbi:hypothetical protein H180DRAFT_05357 [Streptomyces sp. WMMB 322]|nr:hypothetical protein H180DRAFT_05357 [Streptomyces sp. WMMB 322]